MLEDDDLHPLVPDDDTNGLDSVAVEMPEPPAPPSRQRVVAQVRPISISAVVRDIAGRHPFRAVEEMDARYMSRAGAGVGSDGYPSWCGYVERASLKRKAAQISRSESEVYTFLTNNTTSQEQAQQLLDIITNVSSTFFCVCVQNVHYCHYCH